MRHESPFIGRFTAAAATAPYLRMKMSATPNVLEIAGDEDFLGVAEIRAYAAGDPMTLYQRGAPGTQCYIGNGAIAIGDNVSTAAEGKVQTGTSGAVMLGKALTATTVDGEQVEVLPLDSHSAISRSNLAQQDLVPYEIPLDAWRVTGTGALLGATAGTPAGALGLTVGTAGSASPKLAGEAASNNSKTDKARTLFTLPPEYVAGETITFRAACKETVGAATVSTTIDLIAHKVAAEAGVGADICATAAIDVTATVGNKDFTITPTGLVAGDQLDLEITGVTNDTGGAVGTILNIFRTQMLLDIKG